MFSRSSLGVLSGICVYWCIVIYFNQQVCMNTLKVEMGDSREV